MKSQDLKKFKIFFQILNFITSIDRILIIIQRKIEYSATYSYFYLSKKNNLNRIFIKNLKKKGILLLIFSNEKYLFINFYIL